MKILNSELECVAVKPAQYPAPDIPEIAFAGRSNVGKSSLLNLITGRKSLARVSGSPGKTRTINFYRCNVRFTVPDEAGDDESEGSGENEITMPIRIVDLPGYGFARVSRGETEKWGEMMESYLEHRDNLLKVVQLVDIRHAPSAQDVQMYDYLKYYGLDGIVAATKADKVSNNERAKNIREIRNRLGMAKSDKIIPTSALKKSGEKELLDAIAALLAE